MREDKAKQQTGTVLDIREHFNVGKAKYVVSYYTGKKHADGSPFYDIRIFKNQQAKNAFITALRSDSHDRADHDHDRDVTIGQLNNPDQLAQYAVPNDHPPTTPNPWRPCPGCRRSPLVCARVPCAWTAAVLWKHGAGPR